MKPRRLSTVLIGVAVSALVLAGCGGGESESESSALSEDLAVASTTDMTDDEYATYMTDLEAASKKEGGTLSYYFSAPATSAQPLFDELAKKYPWIKIEYVSGGTLELIERVTTESASGRDSADLIQGGPLEDRTLCNDQELCMEYNPRGEKDLPEDRAYADCLCTVADFFTFHILYNTDKLSEAEAPKTFEELTEPKWKGKFGINIDQLDWFAGVLAEMGDKEGTKMMEALAANDPIIYSGSEGLEKLAAGEFQVALPQTATRQVSDMVDGGAPIGVVTTPTVIAQPDMYFALADAPHPATARLYLEFLMSSEWQAQLGEVVKKVPISPEAPVPAVAQGILKNTLFFETTENFGDYDDRVAQHQSIFITG